VTVGEIIKAYLSEQGLKQNKVAEKAGISNDKFNLSMNGKRKIPLDEYAKICNVLGVPAGTFLDGSSQEVEE
jgi:transcriptional regulator with XRE-family HTH domain